MKQREGESPRYVDSRPGLATGILDGVNHVVVIVINLSNIGMRHVPKEED